MKKIIVLLIFVGVVNLLFSQERKTEFKPAGKPFIKVFTNFHSTITDEETHNAFEIQRAYFGYAINLSNLRCRRSERWRKTDDDSVFKKCVFSV